MLIFHLSEELQFEGSSESEDVSISVTGHHIIVLAALPFIVINLKGLHVTDPSIHNALCGTHVLKCTL